VISVENRMQTSTTKNDLIDALCRNLDFPKKEIQELVETLFEMIKTDLELGNTVKLPGFGNFIVTTDPL
jgi:integration host factor subunit alpha